MNRVTRPTQRKTLTAPIRKVRFAWVAIFFCAWVGLIGVRLTWLQVVRHSEWEDKAQNASSSGRSRWRRGAGCCTTATCASWR